MIINGKDRFSDKGSRVATSSCERPQQKAKVVALADVRREKAYVEASKRVSEAAAKINW